MFKKEFQREADHGHSNKKAGEESSGQSGDHEKYTDCEAETSGEDELWTDFWNFWIFEDLDWSIS